MNLIKQLDREGCSTACVAMISGTCYEYVKEMACIITGSPNFRNDSHSMKRFLDNEFNIKSRFIKFNRLKDLKNDSILIVARIDLNLGPGCSVHAIVYDAKKKRILDPDDSDIKDLSNHNVIQCMEIINNRKEKNELVSL